MEIDQVFIYVGSFERGDCDIHIYYDSTYDAVQEEIIKHIPGDVEPPIVRTFYIDNDVVPKFTDFINKNIQILRRQDYDVL